MLIDDNCVFDFLNHCSMHPETALMVTLTKWFFAAYSSLSPMTFCMLHMFYTELLCEHNFKA